MYEAFSVSKVPNPVTFVLNLLFFCGGCELTVAITCNGSQKNQIHRSSSWDKLMCYSIHGRVLGPMKKRMA